MQQNEMFSTSLADSLSQLSDAKLTYLPDFLSQEKASFYFDALRDSLPWRQETIKIYGKDMKSPRLQSWHGDDDATYQYSNVRMAPQPWTTELLMLKTACEKASYANYNSVLVNYYRDGDDAMGWHADDEAELGINPTIASLSLGCERTFSLKHKTTKQKVDLLLGHGSLFIMAGQTQQYWQHAVPRRKRADVGRINLTFRYICA